MKVVKDTIGNTTVFIQALDDDLQVLGEAQVGRVTRPTGIEDELVDIYAKLKSVIRSIAEDIGTEVKSINADSRPKEVEMEFNMSLSAQVGAWVVSGKGDSALKIRMMWDIGTEEKTS